MKFSLFEIYTHPNACVFLPSKSGPDGDGQTKDIDFSMDLIKYIFIINLILGQI